MSTLIEPQQEQQLAACLLNALPVDGTAVGNHALFEAVQGKAKQAGFEVSDTTFWQLRDRLIAGGLLSSRSGNSGAMYQLDGTTARRPTPPGAKAQDGEEGGADAEDEGEAGEHAFSEEPPRQKTAAPTSLEQLRNRLLDLSARNRLLNFSHSRGKRFLRIVDELPDQLFETLTGEKSMRFDPVPEPGEVELLRDGFLARDAKTGELTETRKLPGAEAWAQRLGIEVSYELPSPRAAGAAKHQDRSIQTLHFPPALEERLQLLHTMARSALEETGSNILYLALGFLEWNETVGGKQSERLAPLILVPVRLDRGELNRQTSTYEYRLAWSGEEILTNLSLKEKLRLDTGIALPEIEPAMAPEHYFAIVRETVLQAKPTWRVRRYASLGLFEFSKLMMYLDLDPRRWEGDALRSHRHVRSLTGTQPVPGEGGPDAARFSEEHRIDAMGDVHQRYPLIDDADSSQHSALIDMLDGKDLVIEGPPGTGKSQTITNMIAAAMAQGKRVLFVAEKGAALDVVKDRLGRAGLGDFCLELHSHKSQKQAVLARIGQRLAKRGQFPLPQQLGAVVSRVEAHKDQLNQYTGLLHRKVGQTGFSGHQIFMQARLLREALPVPQEPICPDTTEAVDLAALADRAESFSIQFAKTLGHVPDAGGIEMHPWFGVLRWQLPEASRTALVIRLDAASAALDAVLRSAGIVAKDMELPDLARLPLADIAALPAKLAALPQAHGDEDWALMQKLTAESCGLLVQWLGKMDQLLLDREHLARLLHAQVLDDTALRRQLESAVGQLRSHSDDGQLRLNTVLGALDKLGALLEQAPRLLGFIKRLRRESSVGAAGVAAQPTSAAGLGQLRILLALLQELPAEVAAQRQPLFEDETLGELLAELERECHELKGQQERIARLLRFDRLPDAQTMEDLSTVLADRSLFRWLKGTWRAARQELQALARPGIQFEAAIEGAAEAASFLRRKERLLANPRPRERLGHLFRGMDTDFPILKQTQEWYANMRRQCGRGFGENVWIADWLLSEQAETLQSLRLEAVGIVEYIGQVEALGAELSKLFPFDRHGLHDHDLLSPNGAFSTLAAGLGTAVGTLQQHVRISDPTVRELEDVLARASSWHAGALTLRENHALRSCIDGAKLPWIAEGDTGTAQATLVAWRHTANLVEPVLSLPFSGNLLRNMAEKGAAAANTAFASWRAAGVGLQATMAAWDAAWHDFSAYGGVDARAWWQGVAQGNIDGLDGRRGRLARAKAAENLLGDWIKYQGTRARLAQAGFTRVVEAVENGVIGPEHCGTACRAGVFDSWAKQLLTQHPELDRFSGIEHQALRERFGAADVQLKGLQRAQIAWAIDQNPVPPGVNSGRVKERTELALLVHEAAKKIRHEPIRGLMTRAKDALQALMPCFMMSPMAVAQYLPVGTVRFDLVIIDEASQVRPEDALGSIARGAQVVVVGDPKQLPPTNFFSRQSDDDDGDCSIAQDSESILDAAIPLFALRRLRWHYRSRHESLIAFSNQAFYDGDLVIYPSPHRASAEFGVKLTRAPRGRFVEQRNIEEAELVVKAIEHHLLHCPGESLGVIAMNIKQKDQIERMLEEKSKESADLRAALERDKEQPEPLFIKNLENVQGDERDVIYISFTYGPSEAGGRVHQSFGVNKADGWRRLNVLFTRSKKRMHCFTSLASTDVLVKPGSSKGVRALRDFLHFAEVGALSNECKPSQAGGGDFEATVRNLLGKHGFGCTPQVGVAGVFIDVAVQDPGQPDRYLIGLESDGPGYHAAKSARDRDRLSGAVLGQLGWRLHRIWSVDWYRNAAQQIAPLVQHLQTLRTRPTADGEAGSDQRDAAVEAGLIDQEARQHAEHLAQVLASMPSGSLRERLEWLDRKLIRPQCPDTPDSGRLLRPAMVEALCEFKPATRWEYAQSIPGYLQKGTNRAEERFLDDVLTVICESSGESSGES